MIRPITFICFLLACGSGLYLYQSKHRVQMLDHEIEQTVHATDTLREQTRVLHAEWTLLNDPQRLQALADQFLNLKTVAPGQFTNMAELENRLPPVSAPDPVPPAASPVPIAQAPDTTRPEEPQPPPVIAAVLCNRSPQAWQPRRRRPGFGAQNPVAATPADRGSCVDPAGSSCAASNCNGGIAASRIAADYARGHRRIAADGAVCRLRPWHGA